VIFINLDFLRLFCAAKFEPGRNVDSAAGAAATAMLLRTFKTPVL